MRDLLFIFLLLLGSVFIQTESQTCNQLQNQCVQIESSLDQEDSFESFSDELSVVELEEDELKFQPILRSSFKNTRDHYIDSKNSLIVGFSKLAVPLAQVWLSQMSDSSPPE